MSKPTPPAIQKQPEVVVRLSVRHEPSGFVPRLSVHCDETVVEHREWPAVTEFQEGAFLMVQASLSHVIAHATSGRVRRMCVPCMN